MAERVRRWLSASRWRRRSATVSRAEGGRRRREFGQFRLARCGRNDGNGFRGGAGRRLFGGRVVIQERFTNRLGEQMAHGPFAMEFHLALGRVDVHVHLRRIDFQKQAANRIAVFHQRRVVALQQRKVYPAIFHRAAIDEDMLVSPAGPRDARRADQSPDAQRMRRRDGRPRPARRRFHRARRANRR